MLCIMQIFQDITETAEALSDANGKIISQVGDYNREGSLLDNDITGKCGTVDNLIKKATPWVS